MRRSSPRRASRSTRRAKATRPSTWSSRSDICDGGVVMSTRPSFDPQVIRRDFPLFERDFGGRSLAYLDSAATSLKPRAVLDAVEGYNARFTANVHRGIYTTGEEATAAYEDARVAVAAFLGAPDPHEIVFVRNATEAINLVAWTWGRRNVGRG